MAQSGDAHCFVIFVIAFMILFIKIIVLITIIHLENTMTLIRIDSQTALNLSAIASIKFSTSDESTATVNFLGAAGSNFISETFSGDAARNLYQLIDRNTSDKLVSDLAQSEEVASATPSTEFFRTKSWYFVADTNGHHYFIAFVNAKGSCSMRTFDADTGRFITRKYRAGNYQQQFVDVIRNANELTVDPQPNLERDCKVRLPESVFLQLKNQVK